MAHRNHFFGKLSFQLTSKVLQLRTGFATETLFLQLTNAHPVMQKRIENVTDALSEIEDNYQSLAAFRLAADPVK